MILVRLAKQYFSRRARFSILPSAAFVLRSLRVLIYRRDHQRLCKLDVYCNYAAADPDETVFHHLSYRFYLIRHLSIRDRIACVVRHYHFEEDTFNDVYKNAVYREGGLTLWQHNANGCKFAIRLVMASRKDAEGDLTILFEGDGVCLHQLSFSWIEGRHAGAAAQLLPFVGRNQGTRNSSGPAFAAFERTFPHNSPALFCTAAMQGVAMSVGMKQIAAIKHSAHPVSGSASPQDSARMASAYDGVWKLLGGVELEGPAWLIDLPYRFKPLSDVAGKHRRRAAMRRSYWQQITEAACTTLKLNLKHVSLPPEACETKRQTGDI